MVVLLAPEAADPRLVAELQAELTTLAAQAGYRFQLRPTLSPVELDQVRLVVALPPYPGLVDLAAAGMGAQFLAINFTDLQATDNLSVVAGPQDRPDQVGFLAGYTAAAISEDYRTGVISESETVTGNASRLGFINGVTFFCGLCRPVYPPFPQTGYPITVELPVDAGPEDWAATVTYLSSWEVQTVFVQPSLADERFLATLAEGGIHYILADTVPAGRKDQWVASLGYKDPLDDVRVLLPNLLDGQNKQHVILPLSFIAVNPELLSPGRRSLAERMLADLLAGYIDTGVGPLTGE